MKKIIAILLAVCLYLPVGIILTSCDGSQSHTFKTAWEKDPTHHWHACEQEGCTEVSDKAEHTWNDGMLITPATETAKGLKVLTCTVCKLTKMVEVAYVPEVGVTEEVWNSAIQISNFDNVTFAMTATFTSGASGGEGPHTSLYKLDGNKLEMEGEITTDAEIISSLKNWYIGTAIAIVNNFDAFEYVEAEDCYRTTESISYVTTVMGIEATITATNVSVELDESMNIASITCNMTQAFTEGGNDKLYVLDVEFNFSDYGTTVVG